MRVLRVYHAGRDAAHRARDRALVAAGVEVTLVVPRTWPDAGAERVLTPEVEFEVVELDVDRPGDVNRHRYPGRDELRDLVVRLAPDVVDVHEEPVSIAGRQWLQAAGDVPVVMYTAQNIDKRFPPPFHAYERSALRRAAALYPCSAQAASVARGKGFAGPVEVLPLGLDLERLAAGAQRPDDAELVLGLVGRMVPEKGVLDCVQVLDDVVRAGRPARLELVGNGPTVAEALALAARLGLGARVRHVPWVDAESLAAAYRSMHVVLVPSRATGTWVEQFGRVALEAQSAGAVVAGYASGALPEVTANCGVLVHEGDVAALGRAVVTLQADPVELARYRRRGLARAADFGWASVARRQIALYRRAGQHSERRPAPASPGLRRAAALAEFGRPAIVLGQDRPFAVPILRSPTRFSRLLARSIDRFAR